MLSKRILSFHNTSIESVRALATAELAAIFGRLTDLPPILGPRVGLVTIACLPRNINAPLPGTYTGLPGSGVYPYGDAGPIYEQESSGLYNQNQLVTNVNSRVNRRLSLFGFYVLSFARSNTDGIGTFPANQYNFTGEYGPASSDIRHRASLGGTINGPWDLGLSPLIAVQTGAPFNIVTSQDVYGDTVLTARPGIATDPNKPGVIATSYDLLDPNPSPALRPPFP